MNMILPKILRCLSLALIFCAAQAFDAKAQEAISKVSFGFETGYVLFSSGEFNDFTSWLERERIDNGLSFNGRLRLRISKPVGLVVKVGMLAGKSTGDHIAPEDKTPVLLASAEDEYKFISIPVSAGLDYILPLGKVNLRAEAVAEHHFAKLRYKIPALAVFNTPEINIAAKDNDTGFSIAAGPEWRLFSRWSLMGKAGYRAAKISGLQALKAYLPQDFSLDLSGFFFNIGMEIYP
jgi:hypothetical protein